MSRTTRQARRAAEQAEYEASLERARQAIAEQRARNSSTAATAGLAFGLPGLVVGAIVDDKRRGKTPPRPDLR